MITVVIRSASCRRHGDARRCDGWASGRPNGPGTSGIPDVDKQQRLTDFVKFQQALGDPIALFDVGHTHQTISTRRLIG
jgi:hypothetical protein